MDLQEYIYRCIILANVNRQSRRKAVTQSYRGLTDRKASQLQRLWDFVMAKSFFDTKWRKWGMKGKVRIALFAMMFTLFATSLTVYADNFAISQTKATVNVGDTIDLDVTGTEKTPKWTSWNVNTVKVNQDGEVTAIRTGKTTVSARVGLSIKKCSVTVVGSSVKLNKSKATIYSTGTSTKTVQLKATVKGASKAVTWRSLDESVATVDDKGKVTSVSAGEATITATANDKTASCVVTVKESSISLNMDTMQLSTKGNGSAITLKPTIIGSSKSVKWTTSNKKVATVSGGKVTGKGTGEATITATANGVSTTCTVNVIKNAISIGSEKELLYVGESKTLKSNAAKKDVVIWTSSNEAVATVDSKGKVSATGAGKATICIERNGETDTCEITVKDTSTSIGEDVIELRTKGTDKTYTLGYEIIGRSTSMKWTSSDKKVATVSSKGKVTALKAGTVTITLKANGITDTATIVVKDYIPTIKLNQSEYILYTKTGNTYTLKTTVNGPSKKVTWNTSDASVATVNTKGKVTALKEGTALITATANEVTAECLITVTESKVLLETQNIHLEKGQKAELPVDVIGKSQTVSYASTNTKVATVKNGTITAKKYGEADIKVKANGVTSICHVSVDECVHSFDEGVTTTEPTCIAEGVKTFTCTKCGDTYTEAIEKAEHAWVETQRTEATCVSSGIITYICANCPETKQEFTELGEHSFGEWITVTEASEFSEGLEKRICNNCPQEETRPIAIREHVHEYEIVVVEPTCEEKGYTTYTCRCEDTYIDNYVDELGHDFSDWETVTEATEEAEGLEKRTCKREGCKEEETQAIPKKAHEHVYESVVTEPTCTEKGYTTYTCRCEDTYIDNYVDALGHDWNDWEIVTEATEEAEGLEKRICKREGCKEEETQAIPKVEHEHVYESVVTEPTCTERGFTTYTCRCEDTYIDNYVDALGHDWNDWEIVTEATEEAEGEEKRTCKREGCKEEETQVIPKKAHEHVYNITVVEPTCTRQGYTLHICRCSDSYVDTYVDALGHDWNDWEIVTEATEEAEGLEKRACKREGCKEEETQIIEKIKHEHAYEAVVTKPTCEEKGFTTYTCRCKDTYIDNYVDALGHDFGDWQVTKAPTVEEEGVETRTCSRCPEEETRTIPKHEHVYETIVTEPTCTEQGYTKQICDCGDFVVINQTDALGHDEGTWTTTVEPKLGVDGKKELHCNRCNTLLEEDKVDMLLTDGVDSVYFVDSPDGEAMVIGHYGTDAEVQKMFELVNELRVENGKQPFTFNDRLATIERGAKDRAVTTANYWEHWHYSYSENIAYTPVFYSDYDDMEMVDRVFDSWVASEGHKNNMLNAGQQYYYTALSVFYKKVEVAENHYLYERYWVQVFY